MTRKIILNLALFAALTGMLSAGEVITYQGRLKESGSPANGNRSFAFEFCATEAGTGCVVSPSASQYFPVVNGLFKSTFTAPDVDFASGPWYLRVSVEGTALSPLERLTHVPYSVYAASAAYASSLSVASGQGVYASTNVFISGNLSVSDWGAYVSTETVFTASALLADLNPGVEDVRVAVMGYGKSGSGDVNDVVAGGNFEAEVPAGKNGMMVGLRTVNRNYGTSPKAVGVMVDSLENTGAIGETYGIRIATMTYGTQSSRPYAIYSEDPNALHYFAGPVGVSSASAYSLAVSSGTGDLLWVAQDAVHAIKFVGDGSGLTGVTGASGTDDTKVAKAGDTMSGQLTLAGSTLTVTGDSFSVGSTGLVVSPAGVGVGVFPANPFQVFAGANQYVFAANSTSSDATMNLVHGAGGVARLNDNSGTNAAIALSIGHVNHVLLNAKGDLGIGAINPSYRLHVSSGAGEAGAVMAVSTGVTNVFWVAGDGAHALKFYGDGSALTGINADLSSPLGTLSVADGGTGGTTAAEARTNLGAVNIAGDTMTGQLTMAGSSVTVMSDASMPGELWLSTSAESPHLFVSTGGKVGLGTQVPLGRFHVAGGLNAGNIVLDEGGAINWGTLDGVVRYSSVGTLQLRSGSAGTLFKNGANAEVARFVYDGSLGLGTSVPTARIDVVSTITAVNAYSQVWRDGSSVVVASMSSAGTMMAVRYVGDGSGLVNVAAASGTDSTKVLKAGDTMTGQLTLAGSSLTVSALGTQAGLKTDVGGAHLNTITGQSLFLGTGDVDRMLIDNLGNVALNKTPANYRLDVGGAVNFDGQAIVGGTMTVAGAAFSVGGSTFSVNNGVTLVKGNHPLLLSDNAPYGGGFRHDQAGNETMLIAVRNAASKIVLATTIDVSASPGAAMAIPTTPELAVAKDKVGIGTSSPLYKLHVSSAAGESGTILAVSTGSVNLFWVAGDGAHSTRFYGDGSGLTGVPGDNLGSHVATADLSMAGNRLVSVSTIVVSGENVVLAPYARDGNYDYAISIGSGTGLNYTSGIGIGYGAFNNNNNGVGVGRSSDNNYTFGVGVGNMSHSNNSYGVGVGYYANTNNNYGVGLGASASNNANYGVGIGANAGSNGSFGVGVGAYASANATYAVGVGAYSQSNAPYGTGVGAYAVSQSSSAALGYYAKAPNQEALALGAGTKANAFQSAAIGAYTVNDATATVKIWNNGITISTGGAIQTTGVGYGTMAGNPRGQGATDLQTMRAAATEVASGSLSTIGGGGWNTASGAYSSVPGGSYNQAAGNYSLAAGYAARSTGQNTFTWADSGGNFVDNTVPDRALFKAKGGFMITGSTNAAIGATSDRGVIVVNGTIGISTGVPYAAVDVVSTGTAANIYAQIWRNSSGVVVASMTSQGVLGVSGLAAGDNLGNHNATQNLQMNWFNIQTVSSMTASGHVTASAYQINGSTVVGLSGVSSFSAGIGAGSQNSGAYSTFLGYYAGGSSNSGSYNSFLGFNSGNANTSGAYNTFTGAYAGISNTTGGFNVLSGYAAGYNAQTGSANSVFGNEAGRGAAGSSFSSSTLVGYKAGYGLTTGSDNIFLGFQAGYSVTTGTSNIVIGYAQDLPDPTTSNQLNIGGVLFGNLAAGTIGISTRTPASALDVNGTITLRGDLDSPGDLTIKTSAIASSVTISAAYGNLATGGQVLIKGGGYTGGNNNATGGHVMISAGELASGTGGFYMHAGSVTINAGDDYSSGTSPMAGSVILNAGGSVNGAASNGTLLFKVGNSEKARISGAGLVGIGTASPNYKLDVQGGNINASGGMCIADNCISSWSSVTGVWAKSGSAIYPLSATDNVLIKSTLTVQGNAFSVGGSVLAVTQGKVGVGTADPQYALDVSTINASDVYVARLGRDGIVISSYGAVQTTGMGAGSVTGNTRGFGAVDLQTYRAFAGEAATGNYSIVAGGFRNTASAEQSAVFSGSQNSATNQQAMVVGGYNNVVSGAQSTIAGGASNSIAASEAFVGNGYFNRIEYTADNSVIAGGYGNQVYGGEAAIGGGHYNLVTGSGSVVSGGVYNVLNATSSVISGGERNTVGGGQMYISIGGGYMNAATGQFSRVGGGWENRATAWGASIGGGVFNLASDSYGTVAGGSTNTAGGYGTFVGGGDLNQAIPAYSAVVGGTYNNVYGGYSFVGGGAFHTVDTTYATVAGGRENKIGAGGDYAFIGGGERNSSHGLYSFIGGGGPYGGLTGNIADGDYSSIVGGSSNTITAYATLGFIGGGNENHLDGDYTVVAGGSRNWAGIPSSKFYGAVLGGHDNQAIGEAAFVGAGNYNIASGQFSMVPGGASNVASGDFSYAAGYRSSSTAAGTFSWADSEGIPLQNTVADQAMFKVRGGFWVSTSTNYALPALYVTPGNNVSMGVAGSAQSRLTVVEVSPQLSGGNQYLVRVGTGAVPAMLSVSTMGVVSADSQSMVIASMTASFNVGATGTWQTFPLGLKLKDTQGEFDGNIFTARNPGRYLVTLTGVYYGGTGGVRALGVSKNAEVVPSKFVTANFVSATIGTGLSFSQVYELNAMETLQFKFYSSEAGLPLDAALGITKLN